MGVDQRLPAATDPAGEPVQGMIVCPSCSQLVPAGAPYCPYCCGEDGRRGAMMRGAMLGWLFGFLTGGLASAAWSSYVGPEQTAWTPVLMTTFGCAAAGVIIGMIVNWRR
ncbi:MAG TPA: zinc ribbon domain-containing protein [Candidatus Accumulibacter phosphatis]|nr:MAG: hypothetical protein AW07_02079 [Candidatus Accumulibacter sp. SK-11]HAY26462.1 zinc ribbon domain-containing protein [Accumulibacter sp.]HRL75523.1 zinc ribbon domain-containing protein [Candidatus Accumulibacter phosphatis]HCN68664.1 zinc ribbon domain-containing protein [Accumulibacter sp.]HCV14249.1 zinc ribbon domain-containing protein [Accumulibacter sp.]